jgi:hypothetical protein
VLGGLGLALAGCVWTGAHAVGAELPAPSYQFPNVSEGKSIHQTTPRFTGGLMSPGRYTVEVEADQDSGCHVRVKAPGQPIQEHRKIKGSGGFCSVMMTAHAGDVWDVEAELTGPGVAAVVVRPNLEIDIDYRWMRLPAAGVLCAGVLGVALLILAFRKPRAPAGGP